MEKWLDFEITGDGRGHLTATGFLIDRHVDGNRLNFNIQFDQTILRQNIQSLRAFVDKYPVVGKPWKKG